MIQVRNYLPVTLIWIIVPIVSFAQKNMATINGKVVDEFNIPLENVPVKFIAPQTNDTLIITTDTAGSFQIALPQGRDYTVQVWLFDSWAQLDKPLHVKQYGGPVLIDFTIRIVIDTVYEEIHRLDNVLFEFGSAKLKPESYHVLDQWVKILKENPNMIIEVAGHTDSIGSDEYNLKLSRARAKAVRDYFIKKGIEPSRIYARGYGERQPIADNGTPEGRALNRRVEIRIISR